MYAFADNFSLYKKSIKIRYCFWSDEEYKSVKRDLRKLLAKGKKNGFKPGDRVLLEAAKSRLARLKREKLKARYQDRIEKLASSRSIEEYYQNLNFFRRRRCYFNV